MAISITHNKKMNPFIKFIIKSISATSALQILFLKDVCTFHFPGFPIICLSNYLPNSWFGIILFSVANLSCPSTVSDQGHVTAPPAVLAPEDFLSKKYKPMKQVHIDIHHILDF